MRMDNLKQVLTRTDVSSYCNASPTHLFSAPMFFPLRCKTPITAISLESLGKILLPVWLEDFTAADFAWLVLKSVVCLYVPLVVAI